jgi:hypothetical protein
MLFIRWVQVQVLVTRQTEAIELSLDVAAWVKADASGITTIVVGAGVRFLAGVACFRAVLSACLHAWTIRDAVRRLDFITVAIVT